MNHLAFPASAINLAYSRVSFLPSLLAMKPTIPIITITNNREKKNFIR